MQIETQATNTQIKLRGSSPAINLLCGKPVPDIGRIIQI